MARHETKDGPGLLGWLGIGWVETKCGIEVPARNGPDRGEPVDCPDCKKVGETKYFLGLL